MRDSVLERYALAYIKKSGSDNNVQEFLRSRGMQNIEKWDGKNFENAYKEFMRYSSINEQQHSTERDDGSSRQQPTGPQGTHIHVHNDGGLSFWDYFLLRSLFNSNSGHTTVINNLGSGSSNQQSREDKKKDSEDNRKLLALGIAVVVVCIVFHVGMCFWYNSSEKTAKGKKEIDYLDNQLKMFRNIEFTVSAISLVILIYCAVNPVLPVWGLVGCGINSLVCFAGGLAFHMEHKKESENIKKAKDAVADYHEQGPGHSFGGSSHLESPPPYYPSAPSYDDTRPSGLFSNPDPTQQFEGDRQQYYS